MIIQVIVTSLSIIYFDPVSAVFVLVTVVLFIGFYAYVLLDIKFGGGELKKFCAQGLKGRGGKEIESLSRKSGFAAEEKRGVIFVSVPGKKGGHQCIISLKAGRASEAKAVYVF